MLSDLKFALRGLLKAPGFTLVSVLILTLGIGAVTAVFCAVEAVLLRPFPFSHPDELYVVESSAATEVGLFAMAEYRAYRDQTRAFHGLIAAATFNTNYVDAGNAQLVQGFKITGDAFQVLGVHPIIGRLLLPSDDQPNAAKVVVIGESLWHRSYGGRADVIGRTVSLDGESRQIVGVLPAGFVLPVLPGVIFHSDICLPLQAESDPGRYTHGTLHYMRVVGRLAPGATLAQARNDLDAVLADLRAKHPEVYGHDRAAAISPLRSAITSASRPMLLTVFGVVVALLFLASSNLAGLHLVRAIGRQREFAVRTALGGSRIRLMRLVLAESLLLAVAGAVAGLMMAQWAVASLISLMPTDLPRGQDLQFNGTVFVFVALATLAFGLAPALAPLWLISRSDLSGSMASGGRGATRGQGRVRQSLASVQVALALALLVCTALFLRSFWAVGRQQLGFDSTSSQVLTARLSLPQTGYADAKALMRHYDVLHGRLASLPGVTSVGAALLLPLVPGLSTAGVYPTDHPFANAADVPAANYRLVSSEYFGVMGIPVRDGRAFTERDDSTHPLSAVVGSTLADKFFPQHNAVGQRISVQDVATGFRTATIVGVVSDVKQGRLEDAATLDIWIPYRQMSDVAVPWIRQRTYWAMRGTAPAVDLETALRRAVREEDPSIAVASVRTLGEVTDGALATRRFALVIIGFIAATALILTIAGIYSVVAFGVAQRTREIGVRLALGAQASQIFGIIVREGATIVAVGAPLGVIGTLLLSKLIAGQLYGVTAYDPVALAAALFLVATVALVACVIPARRASRINPIVALQTE